MLQLSFVILMVENPGSSSALYGELLGLTPTEASPSFVMFTLPSGMTLALEARADAEPPVTAPPGGAEIAFTAPDVDAVHAAWRNRGLAIVQAPVDMPFGRTFVALDPDGHRLRVLAPVAG